MRVQLPSGRVVTLEPHPKLQRRDVADLLAARDLFTSGEVAVRDASGRTALDIDTFPLADFHALRAIAARKGWLDEEPVEIECVNCGTPVEHAPCASLPLGPFEERALDDPELDRTLDLGVAHALPDGTKVELGPVTLRDARPLHVAVTRNRPLRVGRALVRALGVRSIDGKTSPDDVARAVRELSDDAFVALGDLFLQAHYPPRLFSMAACPQCGARNDVDAPYDREFEPDSAGMRAATDAPSNAQPFVELDAFAERARARFVDLLGADTPHAPILLVEAGVPACDDGGVPLLGSYVPPVLEGDLASASPARPAEVTLFYRTFRAIWNDEGPYDWQAEIDETLEHELEHHQGWLAGGDAMDDEERRLIDEEAARVHGKRALLNAELRGFGGDVAGFWRRAWPLVILLLAVTLILLMQHGSGD